MAEKGTYVGYGRMQGITPDLTKSMELYLKSEQVAEQREERERKRAEAGAKAFQKMMEDNLKDLNTQTTDWKKVKDDVTGDTAFTDYVNGLGDIYFALQKEYQTATGQDKATIQMKMNNILGSVADIGRLSKDVTGVIEDPNRRDWVYDQTGRAVVTSALSPFAYDREGNTFKNDLYTISFDDSGSVLFTLDAKYSDDRKTPQTFRTIDQLSAYITGLIPEAVDMERLYALADKDFKVKMKTVSTITQEGRRRTTREATEIDEAETMSEWNSLMSELLGDDDTLTIGDFTYSEGMSADDKRHAEALYRYDGGEGHTVGEIKDRLYNDMLSRQTIQTRQKYSQTEVGGSGSGNGGNGGSGGGNGGNGGSGGGLSQDETQIFPFISALDNLLNGEKPERIASPTTGRISGVMWRIGEGGKPLAYVERGTGNNKEINRFDLSDVNGRANLVSTISQAYFNSTQSPVLTKANNTVMRYQDGEIYVTPNEAGQGITDDLSNISLGSTSNSQIRANRDAIKEALQNAGVDGDIDISMRYYGDNAGSVKDIKVGDISLKELVPEWGDEGVKSAEDLAEYICYALQLYDVTNNLIDQNYIEGAGLKGYRDLTRGSTQEGGTPPQGTARGSTEAEQPQVRRDTNSGENNRFAD